MKTATFAATAAGLAGLSAAAPAKRSDTPLDGPFALITSHSGNSEVHLRPVVAVDGLFQIGGADKPTTSCPYPADQCPPGDNTVFAYSPSQTQVGLQVQVPGGQFVYINENGVLAYTGAHTASINPGSVSQGFTYEPPAEEGRVGILGFKGQTAKGYADGFVACPQANLGAPFTITANYEGVYKECPTVTLTSGPVKDGDAPAAYQYDV